MKTPEFLVVSVSDEFVNSVVGFGAKEGWSSVVHDENDDSGCKNIGLDSSIVS